MINTAEAIVLIIIVILATWAFIPERRPAEIERRPPTIKSIVEDTGLPVEEFTCYDCPLANQCRFAFDPYNTNGDCLAPK